MTVPPVEVNLRYILVRGWYKQVDGVTPEVGYIEFTPSTPLSHPYTGIIRMDTTRVDLDEDGKFEIQLLCTDIGGMIPTGWMWFFEEKIKNGNSGYFELLSSMPNPVDWATMVVIPPTEPPSHGVPGTVGIGPNMVTGQTTTVPYGTPAAITVENVGPNTFEVDAVIPEGKQGVPGSGDLYVQPNEPIPPTGLIDALFWVDTDDTAGQINKGDPGEPGPITYVVQPSQPEYVHDLLWMDSDESWTPPSSGVTDHGDLTGLSDDDHPQYLKPTEVLPGANITVDTVTTPGSVVIASTASGGGGGSTILNGAGPPAAGIGAVGNYYLDETNDVLYGPKSAGGAGPGETLFTTQTPTTVLSGAAGTWSFGMAITCAVGGSITGVRYYRPASGPATALTTMALWHNDGTTLLATGTTTVDTVGWVTVTFPVPVTVTAGQVVWPVLYADPAGQECGRLGSAVPTTNGSLSTDGIGKYKFGAPFGYPFSNDGRTFLIDVILGGAPTDPWPVALKSVPVNAGAILSGTATPTEAVGSVGDYYLETDAGTLYGPKVAGGTTAGPPESGFSNQAITDATSFGGYTTGLDFRFAVAGKITGMRFYRHASSTKQHTGRVWANSTTQLGNVALPTTGTGWVSASFAAPITITAGQTVRVSDEYTTDQIWRISDGPDTPIVNGNITILNANATTDNSFYSSGLGVYPTGSTTSTLYVIDVVFTADVVVDPWPVALKSVPVNAGAILSGTAAPTGAVGAVGDYYLDTDDLVLYGPKVAVVGGFGNPQSVYTTQVPDQTLSYNGVVNGGDMVFTTAGRVTALRHYRSSNATQTSTRLHMWHSNGTELANVVTVGETGAAGWRTAVLSTPVTVTAGQSVRLSIDISTGSAQPSYVRNLGFKLLTNGDLQLTESYQDNTVAAGARPITTSSYAYFVDVVFEAGTNPNPPWPVALKSGGTHIQIGTPAIVSAPTGYPLWVDTDETPAIANLSGRNRIINGDFSVNQRGSASTTTSANYLFDRWNAAFTAGTGTLSVQAATVGELPESAGTYMRVITAGQSATDHYCYLRQYIESVRTLSGKQVTVSFWAKAASGTPKVGVNLQQYFGTGGGASSSVSNVLGAVTLSTTWTRYNVTMTLPSITGKVIGTTGAWDSLTLKLWTSAGSDSATSASGIGIQNVSIDFWGVQVEEGSVVTPFEQKTYADELRACQRYFWRMSSEGIYTRYGMGVASTATTASVLVPLIVPMRAIPTLGSSVPSTFLWGEGANDIALTALAMNTTGATKVMGAINITIAAGGTVKTPVILASNNTLAAYIDFHAEL